MSLRTGTGYRRGVRLLQAQPDLSRRARGRREFLHPAQQRPDLQLEVGEAVRERRERLRRGDAAAVVRAAMRARAGGVANLGQAP